MPWFLVLTILFVVLGSQGCVARSRESGALFFLLFGATIAAQGIDALRTGRLLGYFPNDWPVDAYRIDEPKIFWMGTVAYLLMGAGLAALATGMALGWVSYA